MTHTHMHTNHLSWMEPFRVGKELGILFGCTEDPTRLTFCWGTAVLSCQWWIILRRTLLAYGVFGKLSWAVSVMGENLKGNPPVSEQPWNNTLFQQSSISNVPQAKRHVPWMLLLSKGQVHRAADTLVTTSPGASGTCFHSAVSCPWGSAGEGSSSARLQQPSAESLVVFTGQAGCVP